MKLHVPTARKCSIFFMHVHVVSSGLGIPSRQYVKQPSPITFIPSRISSAPSTCISLVGYGDEGEEMEMENDIESHDNNANVSWLLLHIHAHICTYIHTHTLIGLGHSSC